MRAMDMPMLIRANQRTSGNDKVLSQNTIICVSLYLAGRGSDDRCFKKGIVAYTKSAESDNAAQKSSHHNWRLRRR